MLANENIFLATNTERNYPQRPVLDLNQWFRTNDASLNPRGKAEVKDPVRGEVKENAKVTMIMI